MGVSEVELDELIHDLTNDLVVVRAAIGSIKKNITPTDLLETKFQTINEALWKIAKRCETMRSKSNSEKLTE